MPPSCGHFSNQMFEDSESEELLSNIVQAQCKSPSVLVITHLSKLLDCLSHRYIIQKQESTDSIELQSSAELTIDQ